MIWGSPLNITTSLGVLLSEYGVVLHASDASWVIVAGPVARSKSSGGAGNAGSPCT